MRRRVLPQRALPPLPLLFLIQPQLCCCGELAFWGGAAPPHAPPPGVTQTRSPGFNKINSAGQATSAGPMEKRLLKFIAAAPRVGRGQWKMLPNLPSLIRPRCGDGDPGRRLYQRGREIKNAVPPAARLTPAWRYRRAPRRLKGIWGHRSARRPSGKARAVGRVAHRRAPPARVSPPPRQAARSRGEPRCSSPLGWERKRMAMERSSEPAAVCRQERAGRPRRGVSGRSDVPEGLRQSRRAVARRQTRSQPACPWPGAVLRRRGEAGRRCRRCGPACRLRTLPRRLARRL